ncbi:MAG: 3-dehydroquinate synthase [Opitutaceae bacterium]
MLSELRVDLGERSYPIRFGNGLARVVAEQVTAWRAKGRKVAVVADEAVAKLHGAWLGTAFADCAVMTVPAGEGSKTVAVFGQVLEFLALQRLDRGAVVAAVGGGVIGDLVGFAAASFLRGVDFLQVPTTLLAMVDSSVGGKTGINLAAGKNLAGAFHQPRAVFIDTGFLATLPEREFAAGAAEIVKYGLLGDAALYAELAVRPLVAAADPRTVAIVRQCCALKAAVVQDDERETKASGGRALLNLGHTFGHAIEQVTGYKRYLHGEAVGLGLAAAARLSEHLGLLRAGETEEIERVVAAHGLPVRLEPALELAALMAAMQRDKKVRAGRLRFVVLAKIGDAQTREGVPAADVETVWRAIGAR